MASSFESALGNLLETLRLASDRYGERRHEDGMPMLAHLIDVVSLLWHVGEVREQKVLLTGLLYRALPDGVLSRQEVERLMGTEVTDYLLLLREPQQLRPQPLQRLTLKRERQKTAVGRQVWQAAAVARLERAHREERLTPALVQAVEAEVEGIVDPSSALGRYWLRIKSSLDP